MKHSTVEILEKDSVVLQEFGLVISVQAILSTCRFVVGYPGLANVSKEGSAGEALLFETPQHGIMEIRLMRHSFSSATFLVTQVSPSWGIAGALTDTDPQNTPFNSIERQRIFESIENAKIEVRQNAQLNKEQFDLINRKLDDIRDASERLGRKDWLNYATGVLTSVCVSAAFSPATTKAILVAVGSALSWLLGVPPILLP